MAEIIAKFDTKTKELSVTMADKEVPNISSVELWGAEEVNGIKKGYITLRTVERDGDEDMVKVTNIMANEQGEIVEKDATPPSTENLSEFLLS
jgi:hypothetical protein